MGSLPRPVSFFLHSHNYQVLEGPLPEYLTYIPPFPLSGPQCLSRTLVTSFCWILNPLSHPLHQGYLHRAHLQQIHLPPPMEKSGSSSVCYPLPSLTEPSPLFSTSQPRSTALMAPHTGCPHSCLCSKSVLQGRVCPAHFPASLTHKDCPGSSPLSLSWSSISLQWFCWTL